MLKNKLLILSSSLERGGAEEYAFIIGQAAVTQGWEVFTSFPKGRENASLIDECISREMRYIPLKVDEAIYREGNSFRARLFKQFIESLFILHKVNPDVALINVWMPDKGLGTMLGCGLLKIPAVIVYHLFPRFLKYRRRHLLYRWANARNQQTIAISRFSRRNISKSFNMPEENIHCIYSGAKIKTEFTSLDNNQINEIRYDVRKELNISKDSKILLTVARLCDAQKGYRVLIPAIRPVTEQFPEVVFIWVGPGKDRKKLINELKEKNIEEKVLFLGHRKDVFRLISSADLFVFPTRHEGGQSIALAEAMAHRLPVVSSDASGIPEAVENGISGLLFPAGDADKLIESILFALGHPEKMKKMAENAKKRVKDFSEEKMVEKTMTVIADQVHK